MNEDELMAKIKKMAVRVTPIIIHCKIFHKMKQDEEENFTHWVTCLNAKMALCEYNVECNREGCDNRIEFGEILVEEAMVANIYDQ